MNLVLFVVMGKQQGNMKPNMTRENFTLNNEKNDNLIVSFIIDLATKRHQIDGTTDKHTPTNSYSTDAWSILSVSLLASMGMQASIRMTSLTSRNRDFRLTLPWRTSRSGVSSRERICSDPRNRHFENLF